MHSACRSTLAQILAEDGGYGNFWEYVERESASGGPVDHLVSFAFRAKTFPDGRGSFRTPCDVEPLFPIVLVWLGLKGL